MRRDSVNKTVQKVKKNRLFGASTFLANSGSGSSEKRSQSFDGGNGSKIDESFASFSIVSGDIVGIFAENFSGQISSDNLGKSISVKQSGDLVQESLALFASDILI